VRKDFEPGPYMTLITPAS